jgi:multidrug efflux pump subunit AcrA (membrane-fusion protein)/predicted small secreted protein
MRSASRLLFVLLLVLASLTLAACGRAPGAAEEGESSAAKVEDIPGTHLKKIVLTEEGARRLGIRTTVVKLWHEKDGGTGLEVPHSSVFYAAEGASFIYTNPEPLVYIMRPVVIDDVIGGRAFLAKGPKAGTSVVTEGASELLGAETGVEE